MSVPQPLYLSRSQVREIDRRSIEQYHIPGIVLMENASRGAAGVIRDEFGARGRRVVILCGGGNNGGDGLAIARHLHNAGADVSVGLYMDPAKYKGDAATNWQIVRAMSLPLFTADPHDVRRQTTDADLIVDALFGTGLSEPPRPPFVAVVEQIHGCGKPVVAVDLPSGLDCDTGEPLAPAVRATTTVTFVAYKQGFANPASAAYTGRLVVCDIGCPSELTEAVRKSVP